MNADLRPLALRLAAMALGASLAGCGASTPARYYTLSAEAAAPVATTLAARSILVGPIEFPDYLDRPQMAVRGTQGEISFRELERWAEPLDSSFTRALTDNLIVLAGTQQVLAAPIPGELPVDYRLMARVSRFDVAAQGEAVLVVQWYVADRKGNILVPPRQATYRRTGTARPEPETSAAALSGALAEFAADVTRSLAALPPAAP